MKRYFRIFLLNLRFIPSFCGVWSRVLLLELKEESLRRCIKDMRECRHDLNILAIKRLIDESNSQRVPECPVIQVNGKFLCHSHGTITDIHVKKIAVIPGKLINLITENP